MSSRPRKPTGSFVNDPSAINLMQLTPRTDLFHSERSPFTMANHSSKTNFIGDTVIAEGPRAVAVTETGEKHSLHLDDDLTRIHTQLNLATHTAPTNNSKNNANNTQTNQASPTHISENIPSESSGKSSKRKASRRYINQRPRPVFTPRNMVTITPRDTPGEGLLDRYESGAGDRGWREQTSKADYVDTRPKVPKITNVQTQTEMNATKVQRHFHPAVPAMSHHLPVTTNTLHLTPPRKYMRESVGDILDLPRRQPLHIVSPKRNRTKTYSELRNIASALTLITVVSWLFSIFFELDGLLELVTAMMRSIRAWFVEKQQPKTRMELLLEYLNSWRS